jgi:hypothetical protein
VTRGTNLGGSGRKGLTGAGGSMTAQTERWGATAMEQRRSRGHQQGGRGSSRCQCGAWGGVGRFRGGPGQRFTVAQRRQAWQHYGDNRRRRRKGLLQGGAPFIAAGGGWQRVATGGGGGVKPGVVERRQPQLDNGAGKRAPHGFIFFQTNLEIEIGCLTLIHKFPIFACSYIGVL